MTESCGYGISRIPYRGGWHRARCLHADRLLLPADRKAYLRVRQIHLRGERPCLKQERQMPPKPPKLPHIGKASAIPRVFSKAARARLVSIARSKRQAKRSSRREKASLNGNFKVAKVVVSRWFNDPRENIGRSAHLLPRQPYVRMLRFRAADRFIPLMHSSTKDEESR